MTPVNRQPRDSDGVVKKAPETIRVQTPDGLAISAQVWGNPSGPEILFIHGFSQSYLSWKRQFGSDLAGEFRLVTYDLRGHGGSDKPLTPESYRSSKLWADELQSVMAAANLKRPVLVAWSYGGRVVTDYLLTHGAERIAAINFVDATTKVAPDVFGAAMGLQTSMASADLATSIAATRDFLKSCFEVQPRAEAFEQMLAFNMLVPPQVRAGMAGRPLDVDEVLKALKIPVLVTHGQEDRVISTNMAKHTANTIPNSNLSIYEGIGHTPFYEAPDRFNAELAALARAVNSSN
ncbi:alpha/beta fold hydrolase [Bradyrhizobium sp. CCBAU 53421]|uniref:alpha/beta fold hydrolase n=1 Tax=Bradyrhizobium sp. CCBAU 53421 TaxID=1325120 RepID=UPI00188D1D4C|nr:alpha/beta hydrolase [Bradyrhizobium sp. CCBAU 53421]QOZ32795.1 alpha/beta hydrolase [Bradyrhizobium sp. CCBAU 53421]